MLESPTFQPQDAALLKKSPRSLYQAKVEDLQNRLGFLVTLARQLAEQKGDAEAVATLTRVEQALEHSRLQREDTFRASMTEAERRWLRQHRSPEAMHWNVRTVDV